MKRKKETAPALVVIADVLLTVFILGLFFLFHLAIPARKSAAETQNPATPEAGLSATETEGAFSAEVTVETQQDAAVMTPEPTPDRRTPWQIRFAEYFTDQVVSTVNSYTSPNVAIQIETISTGEGNKTITYHVADIHIASIDCFRTFVSHGTYTYFDTQDVLEMVADVGALVSISGDFCTYQQTGFLVRNGEVLRDDQAWCDICVLYEDGTMACYERDTYTNEEIMAGGALQVWNFGPSLLTEEGEIRYDYTVPETVTYLNPRSAVGYYEPGHYCFVVVDGRQDGYSRGMRLHELSTLFYTLGCRCAYNLDGGGTAVMTFQQERYSRQSNGADRELGDILYICEPEGA
ncbi:MAG: phosphodiester glycosidase family protein [Oscillospiraceae bacterium]|nr:phosphodiester glycosidase family protein [Oscillospiraceae bacterium]